MKPRDAAGIRRLLSSRRHRRLWQEWRAIGNDFDRAFSFFEAHKEPLLRLIGPGKFLAT